MPFPNATQKTAFTASKTLRALEQSVHVVTDISIQISRDFLAWGEAPHVYMTHICSQIMLPIQWLLCTFPLPPVANQPSELPKVSLPLRPSPLLPHGFDVTQLTIADCYSSLRPGLQLSHLPTSSSSCHRYCTAAVTPAVQQPQLASLLSGSCYSYHYCPTAGTPTVP